MSHRCCERCCRCCGCRNGCRRGRDGRGRRRRERRSGDRRCRFLQLRSRLRGRSRRSRYRLRGRSRRSGQRERDPRSRPRREGQSCVERGAQCFGMTRRNFDGPGLDGCGGNLGKRKVRRGYVYRRRDGCSRTGIEQLDGQRTSAGCRGAGREERGCGRGEECHGCFRHRFPSQKNRNGYCPEYIPTARPGKGAARSGR